MSKFSHQKNLRGAKSRRSVQRCTISRRVPSLPRLCAQPSFASDVVPSPRHMSIRSRCNPLDIRPHFYPWHRWGRSLRRPVTTFGPAYKCTAHRKRWQCVGVRSKSRRYKGRKEWLRMILCSNLSVETRMSPANPWRWPVESCDKDIHRLRKLGVFCRVLVSKALYCLKVSLPASQESK